MNVPDNFPRISEAQIEALFGLGIDWPWGFDDRTGRSLVTRGWAVPPLEPGSALSPYRLTPAGEVIAKRLVEANDFEAAWQKREIAATWHRVFPETKVR